MLSWWWQENQEGNKWSLFLFKYFVLRFTFYVDFTQGVWLCIGKTIKREDYDFCFCSNLLSIDSHFKWTLQNVLSWSWQENQEGNKWSLFLFKSFVWWFVSLTRLFPCLCQFQPYAMLWNKEFQKGIPMFWLKVNAKQ